jgi:hypothetical protein
MAELVAQRERFDKSMDLLKEQFSQMKEDLTLMGRWGTGASSKNAVKTRREQLERLDLWQCQLEDGASWIGERKQAVVLSNMLGYVGRSVFRSMTAV